MHLSHARKWLYYLSLLVLGLGVVQAAHAQNLVIYTGKLENGWQNWSWCQTELGNTRFTYAGEPSIQVHYTAPSQGFYLAHEPFKTDGYTALSFWINGGNTGNQHIQVAGLLDRKAQPAVPLASFIKGGAILADRWQEVVIPLAALHVDHAANFTGFWLQDASGTAQPPFYLAAIRLLAAPPPAQIRLDVDVQHILRNVSPIAIGLNTACWDSHLNTPATIELLSPLHINILRFPGGSTSDGYHWQTNNSDNNTWKWATDFDSFAHIAQALHTQAFITVNYGSGTPQEAAAWVRYANIEKHYGFKYWEIGNECYGNWEEDHHPIPHDPYTYAVEAAQFITQMKAVDPSIKVGVVAVVGEDSFANNKNHAAVNPRTHQTHYGWTPVMLSTLHQLGVLPDFLIYHRYEQNPGNESDAFLLQAARTWPNDAANLRQQLSDYLGSDGDKVALVCTENNSVSYNPGKQTTSLVNGLYLADSVANLLKTEFQSICWWDLRNGPSPNNNNSSTLYGWRNDGDYGIVSPQNDRYPTYYVFKLLAYFANSGDQIVSASSNYDLLSIYAVRHPNGSLSLLIINKSPDQTLTGEIHLAGFNPQRAALCYSYGIPQDDAARTGKGSPDLAMTRCTVPGATFRFQFAPYSANVLLLKGK
ncbi:alpha-L-arabinofuranosidase [Chthonomonas calidirosea]|uniref:alpha-L-arabinofuranosidase n=1 Tax=Chthonomonas calidirosea TaxID=454171 RepID=UPI0006EC65A9|nr:alpha-L-arabinofuranosidase [Chthonomonas calidirosea]CEK14791.1 hypothetical protein CP488_00950 [Chthonomonas calidirosea]